MLRRHRDAALYIALCTALVLAATRTWIAVTGTARAELWQAGIACIGITFAAHTAETAISRRIDRGRRPKGQHRKTTEPTDLKDAA